MADLSHLGGWIDDGGHHAVGAGIPLYSDVRPLELHEPTKPILLYKAWKQILGAYPDYKAQEIGDCVSMGHGHGNDLLQCIEIAYGEPSEYRETDTEFLYAASRKVANILGRRDGSYGSAAVKAMTTMGIVSREMLGAEGAYSGSRAKNWGYYGPPAEVESMAAPYKLGYAAKIVDNPSAISALWAGCPITICSNCGFNGSRDEHGFIKAKGYWGHCMLLAGYDPGFDRYLNCQSWGPNTPSGPLYLDQPTFSFWVDAKEVERYIFSQGDSWALVHSPEFVKRPIPADWTQA